MPNRNQKFEKSLETMPAFASTSSRFTEQRSEGPDPGAYSAQSSFSSASRSHSRSGLAGRGGFGSTGRDLPWGNVREERPHPAAADAARRPKSPGPVRAASKSSAFASGSNRFAATKSVTPGPGEYTDRAPLADNNSLKRSSSFGASKAPRFGTDKNTCNYNPGPGEYSRPGSFEKSTREGTSGSAAFASKTGRALPGHNASEDGSEYISLGSTLGNTNKSQSKSGSAAFADSSSRFLRPMQGQGADVGTYSTDQNSIASQASKSHSRSSVSGAGGFGSRVARPALSAVNDAPGPGAYDSAGAVSSCGRGAGSAFKSTSARFSSPSRRGSEGAAPGAYNPHSSTGVGSVRAVSTSARNGKGSFGSKTKRSTPGTSEAMSTPAPGAYSQGTHSIAHRAKSSGGSAGFASESMRALPWE